MTPLSNPNIASGLVSIAEQLGKMANNQEEKPMKGINQLVQEAHQNAIDKGWWNEERSFGEVIALIHSEASEALEFYREGCKVDDLFYTGGVKPDGIPAELADIVIRVFDTCGRFGVDLERAIVEKMGYNATRPQRHGGKVL